MPNGGRLSFRRRVGLPPKRRRRASFNLSLGGRNRAFLPHHLLTYFLLHRRRRRGKLARRDMSLKKGGQSRQTGTLCKKREHGVEKGQLLRPHLPHGRGQRHPVPWYCGPTRHRGSPIYYRTGRRGGRRRRRRRVHDPLTRRRGGIPHHRREELLYILQGLGSGRIVDRCLHPMAGDPRPTDGALEVKHRQRTMVQTIKTRGMLLAVSDASELTHTAEFVWATAPRDY